MHISRRDALTGATAAVAVATVPTVAQAATGPTEVERLYADLLHAREVHSEVGDALWRAYQKAKALFPEPPYPITGKFPTPRFALEALLNKPGVDQAEIHRGLEKLDAYDAECALIQDEQGMAALDIRNDETYDRIREIQEVLLDTPSITIRDVHLKILSEFSEGRWRALLTEDGIPGNVSLAVMRDLERLAGGGRRHDRNSHRR